ncbi:MAG TPA: GNAT family N-acetyltransferase [Pilimelia sp.]|nr:GNAT family N-acetyltransferase [Pilimelia sp.]
MEPVEISEGGLRLRPWRAEDVDAVYRACQDPEILRWTPLPSPYLREHAVSFVTERSPAAWESGTGAHFAVLDAGTDRLLGSCGLVSIDGILNSAEVGYWTAPWARRRGVAVRATRAVARWAFDSLGLNRLVWQAEIGNHASRLVALRVGFRIEGQLRLALPHSQGGVDAWIGSLLPGEISERDAADPGVLEARRAAVFSAEQPVLHALTASGPIHLRRPTAADIDSIVAACRDPDSVRWTTVPDPYQRTDAEFFVGVHAPGRWARGDGATFTIAEADGRLAGTIEVRISGVDRLTGDVGFLVAPWARGRGYAPAALRAIARWAIATLGLTRLEWRAEVGNHASRRVAEKAGFTIEGTARSALTHRGRRRDAWVGAVTAEDMPTTNDVHEDTAAGGGRAAKPPAGGRPHNTAA